ncbi:tRNA uridine-5-carboxymethylaminomethyl(34) synthesis GTPase MnmE [Propylenella binzhouense]|uniref:tRNA modification GTPase MnmE n=1 Tax=Propylenella binzhouense TaxID=2555902 RepID=A0A964T1X1_9HYPH|nr:tRNA uridine-5-carboxymethylaminomethyl(34) synthesis GTPase MnmE [Propylenella binzhouense]MYZ46830.1 tRNA uridine-5-carboxymethylaminomethyl(34) synthesis GTPase MnmE [Propylenella binzhouense]
MDTIYALSSGGTPAGVAVIRISGPGAAAFASDALGSVPPAREAVLRSVRRESGEILDRALVLFFPGPASFTGEDVLEIQCHGGRAVVASVLDLLGARPGLRIARPGEFTRRAFDHGRLDLVAVEALADLVAAETEAQRRQALAGDLLSRKIEVWRGRLVTVRAEIEARLDFSDEDAIGEAVPEAVLAEAAAIREEVAEILSRSAPAERVRSGFRVAIAGRPNAGKSSLLNAIAARDVAIVTAEPGTTRDVLEVPLDLGGYPVLLYDTAGLREAASLAEREGVARARRASEHADLVLWLAEPARAFEEPESAGRPVWRVLTKSDLLPEGSPVAADFVVSARTGSGVPDLVAALGRAAAAALGGDPGIVAARARQREALAALSEALSLSAGDPDEIVADRLRQATDVIGRLTGRVDIEEVLDHLFAEFCIGK